MNEEQSLWSWSHAWAALPQLIEGFLTVTLIVTVLGSAIAAVLGLVIALVRRTAPRPVAGIVTFVMNFVRMTPIVVQLLFVYYAFTSVPPLTLGIIIFGIHYATYMAEVYRAGIEAVPRGQWEATTALSMSRRRTWTAVVIPQAIRSTLPALGNYVVSMFKDTPFLAVITVTDMVRAAQLYGGSNFRYIEAITLAGIFFLIASYPTSLLIRRLEKRVAYAS
ncbi:ectoine/hydroxyectoine ABC transporter permease subunit EhuD [Pseudoclavibacter endophyticus]|uniref:Ectoine/hydroxyectoine ABC transporter permease subunit EhuD n=1 Tax=Pseudoclavibacter endophyticus TaxID=1778590 RepID=A0A6H9WRH0_9MICO|nr:ectoine/hydroxyectoine ABC transporter permease subunit EhuD [Pseudoclavibacter endophyticus]KAB1649365.1 ectoine/hydroxyectoine ABC transporter permease subunit EhuD [Pseudoclavibacter endophyticus]GGA63169.1 ectoine/hydroxyectoine ABC transporter permease subunit EhuD [Pseudoclavibacter endophyticus]